MLVFVILRTSLNLKVNCRAELKKYFRNTNFKEHNQAKGGNCSREGTSFTFYAWRSQQAALISLIIW